MWYVQRPRLFLRASRLISHARGSETSSLAPPLHGVCAMGVRAASPVAIVSRALPAAQGMTGAKFALHANVVERVALLSALCFHFIYFVG